MLGRIAPNAENQGLDGHGRVDAAIELDDAVVLIEVKIVADLDYAQLARHAADWGIPDPGPDPSAWPADSSWYLASWPEVHAWLRQASRLSSEPVTEFLLRELIEYLEQVGLAPLSGFRRQHFEFFALPPAKRAWEIQSQIKIGLLAMWDAVLQQLGADMAATLGNVHAAQLPIDAQQAAAQTNWGARGTNITIELTADELWINLVGWTTERAQLIEKWLAPGQVVRSDPRLDGFELAVFRRRPYNYAQKNAGRRPWYQQEAYHFVARNPLSVLAGEPWPLLIGRWREEPDPAWEKLAYHIRKAWPRDEVLRLGDDLVPEMATVVGRLSLLMREVNQPVAH